MRDFEITLVLRTNQEELDEIEEFTSEVVEKAKQHLLEGEKFAMVKVEETDDPVPDELFMGP